MSKVSIALVGKSFYLCGPNGNNINFAATKEFEAAFDHRYAPEIHHKYVALGQNGSYYFRYVDGNGESNTTWNLRSVYPGLDEHVQNKAYGDPICVSLGENGHYFINTSWGRAWNLPDEILDYVSNADEDDKVEKLWLGIANSYVAQTENGSMTWNLKGHYGSLDQMLKYNTVGIRCLGLNITDDTSYFVLFKDGSCGSHGVPRSMIELWHQRLG